MSNKSFKNYRELITTSVALALVIFSRTFLFMALSPPNGHFCVQKDRIDAVINEAIYPVPRLGGSSPFRAVLTRETKDRGGKTGISSPLFLLLLIIIAVN
jgi:hypothetical protein